jgi:CxxC motif-containing protein
MEVQVEGKEVTEVKGNKCKEGIEYARQEVFSPERILTSTVKTGNPEAPLLPVRSDKPLPKEKLEESMEVIAKHTVSYPIQLGEVIISNILNTGINIIASRSMSEKS